MRQLRIVFMGTPDFAVASLQALVENKYAVVGVITAPDKPAGRGRAMKESAVKKYASDQRIPILQPPNLKNDSFLKELKSLNANLQVVVAFRMLPKVVWSMPLYGTFNLHASLLPAYRGAAPINWAIINGEEKTGVTTFFIDEKIDTGAIILQEECPISHDDTAGTLHDKLMIMGAALVLKTVLLIQNDTVKTLNQKELPAIKEAPKIIKETCMIHWDQPVEAVYNHIRGLSPYPAAWTTLISNKDSFYLKIYDVTLEKTEHKLNPGTLLSDKDSMKVAAKGGYVYLNQIQLPGKRKMAVKDVLNGLKLDPKAYVL